MEEKPTNIVSDLFQFDRLIGKSLVKVVYYVGLVGIGLWALFALVGGIGAAQYNPGAAVIGVAVAAMVIVLGSLFWRLSCEMWVVLFRIHDELKDMNAKK